MTHVTGRMPRAPRATLVINVDFSMMAGQHPFFPVLKKLEFSVCQRVSVLLTGKVTIHARKCAKVSMFCCSFFLTCISFY